MWGLCCASQRGVCRQPAGAGRCFSCKHALSQNRRERASHEIPALLAPEEVWGRGFSARTGLRLPALRPLAANISTSVFIYQPSPGGSRHGICDWQTCVSPRQIHTLVF